MFKYLFIANMFVYAITINSLVVYFELKPKKDLSAQHTKVFNSWNTQQNNNNSFFDTLTFGIEVFHDPCTPIPTNKKFKDFVNSNIRCTGDRCIKGKFNCIKGNNVDCYNVEHIFDKRNGSLYKNKNIAANMVMAWGEWNQQLGRISYTESMTEKMIIYGDYFERVKTQMDICNGIQAIDPIKEFFGHTSWVTLLSISALFIIYILVVVGIFFFWKRKTGEVLTLREVLVGVDYPDAYVSEIQI
jgi:hypothetical protein